MESIAEGPLAGQSPPSGDGARPWSVRADSPWVVALITVLVYLLFVTASLYAGRHDRAVRGLRAIKAFDYSAFVNAGDKMSDPARVPAGLTVIPNSMGFDGQYFYRLALDPATDRVTAHGIRFDEPSYRQERILYPLIAWAASGGDAQAVPKALLLVNLVALGVIGGMAGALAQRLGRHALWGMMAVACPGFLFTIHSDTCELVDMAFLVSALWCLRGHRPVAATVLLTLACFARETSLAFAGAAFLVWLWERRGPLQARMTRWYLFAAPLVSVGLWELFLKHRWGVLPSKQGGNNVGLPFQAFLHLLLTSARPGTVYQHIWFVECLCIIAFVAAVLLALRRSAATALEKTGWTLFAVLTFSSQGYVWSEDENFLRTMSGFYVLGALILIGANSSRLRRASLAGTSLLWLLVTLRILL